MIQLEPLSRAVAKGVSVGVAQLKLDVLVISFHSFPTDSQFFRDPARSEAGTPQREDVKFAVRKVRFLGVYCRALNDLVNRAQSNPWTHIELTCENNINGTDQLFSRTGFHPVA